MDGWLLWLDRLRLSLQKRAGVGQDGKSREAWLAKGYAAEPEVTVVIESHNKSRQVAHVVRKLRRRPGTEIIVVDDGSTPGHTRALTALLTGANEWLVRANDLYENLTYDRCLRMAAGRYVALLQDDDDFDALDWMDQAVGYFERYPRLCILGGSDALRLAFEHDPAPISVGQRTLTFCGPRAYGQRIEPRRPFDFVPAVNRAPMWIRRDLFLERLRHIDARFAPFQYDDYELCSRAWLEGLQVGWYDAGFHSLAAGGMRLWNRLFTQQQVVANGPLLYDLYYAHREEIDRRVAEAKRGIMDHNSLTELK